MSFRLFGFEVIITSGSFLLFALIFFMAFSAFPESMPVGLKVPLGISATAILLAMILAHELSHALVATSKGISVQHIGFFPFGAGTALEQESRTPGDEFLIAVVGPLTSIGIGVAASITGAMFRAGIGISMLEEYLSLLLGFCGYWSIMLGLFNLLPAFPVDGGKMIRVISRIDTARLYRRGTPYVRDFAKCLLASRNRAVSVLLFRPAQGGAPGRHSPAASRPRCSAGKYRALPSALPLVFLAKAIPYLNFESF